MEDEEIVYKDKADAVETEFINKVKYAPWENTRRRRKERFNDEYCKVLRDMRLNKEYEVFWDAAFKRAITWAAKKLRVAVVYRETGVETCFAQKITLKKVKELGVNHGN